MKLSEICINITDGKHGDCSNQFGSGYYFLSAKDIHDRILDYSTVREITKGDFLETHRRTNLEPGDILLTNSGTIGRMAIARDDERTGRTTFQKSVAIIKPNKVLVNSEFLYYYLLSKNSEIVELAGGTTQKNLLLGDLRCFEIPLPPLPEQRAVAEVLSSLDDKIELNRRMNRTLEQLAQAIYKHMFVDNPEREGWGTKRLGEIADVNWGDTNTTKASYVTDGFIAFSAKGPDGYLPYYDFNVTGVVLSAIGANSGMTWLAQGKWSCIKNTIRFWSTSEEVSTEYLFMATFGNEKWPLRGSAQPFISQTDARNMLINVPEKGLAKKFGDLVNPLFSQMDHNTEQNKVLAELRDTLLPKLMSGQVRVNGTTTSLEQDR
ncbi:MAG: restriction endonuclease subunit S [Anaerolineaceae bacterium]|nr:restriction endonuclease subunit S [Anaerolineaceae bacterium]